MNTQNSLSTTEYLRRKAHVLTGESIVRPAKSRHFALRMIRHDHEHYNGTECPDGFNGEEIPLRGRIIGAADAFDAMNTQRPYNEPLGFKETRRKCAFDTDKHFDPSVIKTLARFINRTTRNQPALFANLVLSPQKDL